MDTEQSNDGGGMNRRNLIKAGVATGVAAAAWASPSIQSASVVALEAANCTVDIITFTSDKVNTNRNDGCRDLGYIEYGNAGGGSVSVSLPGYGSLTIFPDNPTTGDRCSYPIGPSYGLVPSDPNSDLECDVGNINIYRQSSGVTVVPVTDPGRLPGIPYLSDNAPVFVEIVVECCPKANWHP